MTKPTVFISYSHKDERFKDELCSQLGVLEHENLLDVWEDRRIETGDDWLPEIKEAIERAKVAVLLISQHFLNSNFILHKEVPRIMERRTQDGLRVYPVILRSCPFTKVKWLSPIQVKPKDGKPLAGFRKDRRDTILSGIAEEIIDLIEKIQEDSDPKLPCPPDKISLSKLPATTAHLFGRDAELKILDEAWNDPKTKIVSLVASGGVGKSALVNSWHRKMGEDNYRGAEMVYGWSFYSQGASVDRQISADVFIAEALGWFGDPNPDEGSPWQKGERLAEYVKKHRTLLILDGMEPLQDPHQDGRIKDPGLQSLLRELANDNRGLCIVTTRLSVADLQEFSESSVCEILLDQLSPKAGAELLDSLGVIGMDGDLKQASKDFGCHALALTLLGKYLKKKHKGEIHKRHGIPPLTHDPKLGGHARRVMESYELMFAGEPELDVLRILGLFDRPAKKEAIDSLTAHPVIPGLTDALHDLEEEDWNSALDSLQEVGLLHENKNHNSGALDCHPLIREHFGERLQEENHSAWKEAHSRLYEYYQSSAKELPDTIEEMEPLYALVMHGCRAGRYQEVFKEVYWKRILRGDEHFSWRKLATFGADLAAVSCFFEKLWDRPAPELSEPSKAVLFDIAGFHLRALGRLREAAQPMQAGLNAQVEQDNWNNASVAASNLSELFLTVGDVAQSVEYGRQSVEYADRSGDNFQKMSKRTTLANAQHQAGILSEAEAGFGEAEAMQTEWQPDFPLLYSLRGYQYCDLLLNQGKCLDVKRRTEQTIEIEKINNWLLTIALNTLSLGRAEFMRVLLEGNGNFEEAAEILNRAVDGLRKAGAQHHIPRGLLARAEFYRVVGDFEHAHWDLREVMTIAKRGEMRLHESDCRLQYGRLYLAEGDGVKAREELEKAEKRIEEMGYGRRKPEVQVDYARLLLHEGKREEAREHLRRGKALVEEMGYHCLDKEVGEIEDLLK